MEDRPLSTIPRSVNVVGHSGLQSIQFTSLCLCGYVLVFTSDEKTETRGNDFAVLVLVLFVGRISSKSAVTQVSSSLPTWMHVRADIIQSYTIFSVRFSPLDMDSFL
jgi:hypothetical protein